MKKVSPIENDIRPEYDFASMPGGIRGKYVERLRRETNIVVLEPEIAEAFPTGEATRPRLPGTLIRVFRLTSGESAREWVIGALASQPDTVLK